MALSEVPQKLLSASSCQKAAFCQKVPIHPRQEIIREGTDRAVLLPGERGNQAAPAGPRVPAPGPLFWEDDADGGKEGRPLSVLAHV